MTDNQLLAVCLLLPMYLVIATMYGVHERSFGSKHDAKYGERELTIPESIARGLLWPIRIVIWLIRNFVAIVLACGNELFDLLGGVFD